MSYPIEIGWAWAERSHIESRSILVKPSAEWLSWKTGWNPEAERLHGISLEQLLREGIEAPKACGTLNYEWHDAEVFFDTGSGAHDSRWLSTLYRAASLEPSFWLSDLSSDRCILSYARMSRITDTRIRALEILAPKHTHRAAQDAAKWAWHYLAVKLIADREIISESEIADLASSIQIKFKPTMDQKSE
ncbi:hypothetical protein FNB15_03585 [Ferrovibrio terrae]|uniref:Uncharacterized protein n=1 Tax=Ferrovibrio terrae TaxID=2594003 RepID=A0A516GY13_9PROT|nr:hypothetical protein [Ferrovibrio terrae]QDO96416.1 hypothetical protein FNB15_03585 [Ferrovibrio terrae]